MSRALLRSFLLLVVATFLSSNVVMAGAPHRTASTAGGCPSGTACDRVLGVALVPAPGWQQMPVGKLPPHTIGLFGPPVIGLSYNVRLIIGSDGTTGEKNDVRAVGQAANALTRGYSRLRMRPPLVRVPVRYGGAPGVMILNLPGQPTLVIVIVLAHRGALYRIAAPGATLARDQRQALGSLRFIPRVGLFPPANPPAPRGRPSQRTIPDGARFPMAGAPATARRPQIPPWQSTGIAGIPLRGANDFDTVAFATPRRGCAGGRTLILCTSDAGRTWRKRYTTRSSAIQTQFVDPQHGWAVAGSQLLATADGGRHWRALSSIIGLRAVDFVSQRKGWAVTDSGMVLVTDNGRRFVAQHLPERVRVIDFLNAHPRVRVDPQR